MGFQTNFGFFGFFGFFGVEPPPTFAHFDLYISSEIIITAQSLKQQTEIIEEMCVSGTNEEAYLRALIEVLKK